MGLSVVYGIVKEHHVRAARVPGDGADREHRRAGVVPSRSRGVRSGDHGHGHAQHDISTFNLPNPIAH